MGSITPETDQTQPAFEIPLVDFSRYQQGTPAEKKACVEQIMRGFTTSGFLYLQNTGLSPSKAYDWSARFFGLPLEEKQKYPNIDREANRGYSGFGLEKNDQRRGRRWNRGTAGSDPGPKGVS